MKRVIFYRLAKNTFVKIYEQRSAYTMDQKVPKESKNLAGRIYEPSDYQKKDQLSSGLAETHEQFSDAYMEGEIGAVIDDVKGKDIPVPKKGFNKEKE